MLHRREIPRLRVPTLRAKAKNMDTPLGMTTLGGAVTIERVESCSAVLKQAASWSHLGLVGAAPEFF